MKSLLNQFIVVLVAIISFSCSAQNISFSMEEDSVVNYLRSEEIFNKVLKLYKAKYAYWQQKNFFITKSDGSPVSAFEQEVEYEVGRYMHSITPWASFEGEEGYVHEASSHSNFRYKWYIDPIDGTISFRNRMPFFGFTLTLVRDLEPIATLIYFPSDDTKYEAFKGQGAFFNGKKFTLDLANHEHQIIARSDSYIFRHYKGAQDLDKIEQLPFYVRTYTDIQAYTFVASGKIAAKIDAAAALWDLFPGVLLIKEAGGVYFFYPADDPTHDHYGSVIVGNKFIVEYLHNTLHPNRVVYKSTIPQLNG